MLHFLKCSHGFQKKNPPKLLNCSSGEFFVSFRCQPATMPLPCPPTSTTVLILICHFHVLSRVSRGSYNTTWQCVVSAVRRHSVCNMSLHCEESRLVMNLSAFFAEPRSKLSVSSTNQQFLIDVIARRQASTLPGTQDGFMRSSNSPSAISAQIQQISWSSSASLKFQSSTP